MCSIWDNLLPRPQQPMRFEICFVMYTLAPYFATDHEQTKQKICLNMNFYNSTIFKTLTEYQLRVGFAWTQAPNAIIYLFDVAQCISAAFMSLKPVTSLSADGTGKVKNGSHLWTQLCKPVFVCWAWIVNYVSVYPCTTVRSVLELLAKFVS